MLLNNKKIKMIKTKLKMRLLNKFNKKKYKILIKILNKNKKRLKFLIK